MMRNDNDDDIPTGFRTWYILDPELQGASLESFDT